MRAERLRRQSLREVVDGFLGDRTLPEDVDRARLRQLGEQYLQEASGAEAPYDTSRCEPVPGL